MDKSAETQVVYKYYAHGGYDQISYEPDGKTVNSKYEYNSSGKVIRITSYNSDGSVSGLSEYSYNSDGSYSSSYFRGGENLFTVFEFDTSGRQIKGTYYKEDGQVDHIEKKEYRADGIGITKTYDASGEVLQSELEYKYPYVVYPYPFKNTYYTYNYDGKLKVKRVLEYTYEDTDGQEWKLAGTTTKYYNADNVECDSAGNPL